MKNTSRTSAETSTSHSFADTASDSDLELAADNFQMIGRAFLIWDSIDSHATCQDLQDCVKQIHSLMPVLESQTIEWMMTSAGWGERFCTVWSRMEDDERLYVMALDYTSRINSWPGLIESIARVNARHRPH